MEMRCHIWYRGLAVQQMSIRVVVLGLMPHVVCRNTSSGGVIDEY